MWSNWILYQQLTAIACLEASGNWVMENHCPMYSVDRTASAIFVARHPFGFITNSPRQRLLVLPIQPHPLPKPSCNCGFFNHRPEDPHSRISLLLTTSEVNELPQSLPMPKTSSNKPPNPPSNLGVAFPKLLP